MKILITGVGGFVGHHVLKYFLENTDWEIIGLTSKSNISKIRLNSILLDKYNSRLKIIKFNFLEKIHNDFIYNLEDADYVINLASKANVKNSVEEPTKFIINNILLQLNMLEYAKKNKKLKSFIQVSSDEIYGPSYDKIFHKEWSPIVPSTPYSASKESQESIAISYWRSYDIPLVITNNTNLFGEMQSVSNIIPLSIYNILNNKDINIYSSFINKKPISAARLYIHSRNKADALKFIIENNSKINNKYSNNNNIPERFNISGDDYIYNDDLVLKISNILEKKAKITYKEVKNERPGYDVHYGLDNSKIKNLGWSIPETFDESLEKTVKWYVDNGWWFV